MSELTNQDVQRIAKLAKLGLSPKQVADYKEKLSGIITFVEHINEANLDGIEPMVHSLELQQRMREDFVSETDQSKELQANAPLVEAGLFLVPKVLEDTA